MKVSWNDPHYGRKTREFTKELHGENYKEVAKGLADQYDDAEIKDDELIEEPKEEPKKKMGRPKKQLA